MINDFDEQDFLNFYEIIKQNIISNYKTHIFNDTVKSELYKVLSLYRERCKDNNFLEDINNLISILNISTDKKHEEFLKEQFFLHYNMIIPHKNMKMALNNINRFEDIINQKLTNDFYIVYDLLNENISSTEFAMNYLFHDITSTINYLLNCYPELFKQEEIKMKINALLSENNVLTKQIIESINLLGNNNISMSDDEIKLLKKNSKKILKKIKKL